ncbi:MAG: DUF4136 domain-containing protein [Akkermansiaceae bacterium]|nr:DUF4136 domain-containing protein [Akkermansiaceae bacterium]MCF7732088.1 DUF4136 domain-containing protein [Akkermansiaceae bacterium]
MLQASFRILIAITCLGFVACSTGVDQPKGTSKGYTSARLVRRDPKLPPITATTELKIHRMVQQALASQFEANGIAYGKPDAELTVAYLVIYQEPGMTASYPDYFGYGRSSEQIAELAHTRGAVDSKRPDYFERAGIVVDVIDTRTNKLVFRNHAAGDIHRSASDSTRAARIDAAVGQALLPFFGKR